MLNLETILQQYPEYLWRFRLNILTEYLQYQILQIIFDTPFASKLAFLGGTALRIVYDNTRFSEDLDFDNFGLSKEDFEELRALIVKKLEQKGYVLESRSVFKGAYRCYIKFLDVLFLTGITTDPNEKLLIQFDTAPHHFAYKPDSVFINKFGFFREIFVTPLDILLPQKICAAFGRKRLKGRDFYDLVFLFGMKKPINFEYLKLKLDIADGVALKKYILDHCEGLDFVALATDVEPLLFDNEDKRKVLMFKEYVSGLEF